MRERIRDNERLEHMLDAMRIIDNGIRKYSLEQIKNDPIVYYGFVKQVEIIGEATYMLTKEFRETHTEVLWNKIEGMRHVLVHGYYAINPQQLLRVITEDIPVLRPQIEQYIKEEERKRL